MLDEERENGSFEDGDADMETDKVDVTSHNRETVKNGKLCSRLCSIM